LRTTNDHRSSIIDQWLMTNDRFQEVSVQEELHHARSLGLSVALGAAMGAAIGAATGHMGVWVAAGIAAYIAISLVGGAWRKKPNDQR
jgi:uncharacterized membrane protein YoaK (UPF0700 family)